MKISIVVPVYKNPKYLSDIARKFVHILRLLFSLHAHSGLHKYRRIYDAMEKIEDISGLENLI